MSTHPHNFLYAKLGLFDNQLNCFRSISEISNVVNISRDYISFLEDVSVSFYCYISLHFYTQSTCSDKVVCEFTVSSYNLIRYYNSNPMQSTNLTSYKSLTFSNIEEVIIFSQLSQLCRSYNKVSWVINFFTKLNKSICNYIKVDY